jgi:septal ring factor EnvC (AmiA/AmiB activator)
MLLFPSFRRRPDSTFFARARAWAPAFAGVTLLWAFCAHAAPADKLHDLEQKLHEQQSQQQVLAKKLSDVKGDLAGTQNKLVKLAASIRANEQELTGLDARIADLTKQDADLTDKLQSDYGSISGLILALERIRRIPPESLIARPGAPLQTAQSAMLLQGILPAVNARAEQVSKDLEHLAQIRKDLADDRDASAKTGASLQQQYADMQGMLGKRKAQFIATQSDYRQSQQDIARLSKDADNLRDLMAKLAEEDRRQARQAAAQRRPAKALPSAGIPDLPVAGVVETAFGGKDAIDAVSEGIRVKTRAGALVTAPMGGVVKFAGSFRNYGQMVILEHEGDYHSLIGGLGSISVAVGQSVKSGEPLGNMPANMPAEGASSEGGGTLYYELRHNGRPIDPSTKLRNLRS